MLVLIVEDDPLVALDLAEIVRESASADVVVGSTLEGAQSLLAEPVDFALFDIDLDGGKTHGLAASLQARQVPFAFVSGSRPGDLPHELQAAPFIRKPYAPEDIRTAVRSAALGPEEKQAA